MAHDNSTSQLDNENNQTKRRSGSINFNDKPENLPVSDWQNKKCKHIRATVAEKDYDNITV